MHIQTYSKPCVTLAYSEPWYIQNPDIFRTRSIFRTLAYVELWYIQNPLIFRTLAFSNSEAYSEPCQTSTMKHFAKIVNGYNYFCSNSFPRSLLHETNIMKQLLQRSLFYIKNYATQGDRGSWIFDKPIDIFRKISLFAVNKTCDLTKIEVFLRYFLRILFKSFRGLLLQYRTPPCISGVIANTLYTIFLR